MSESLCSTTGEHQCPVLLPPDGLPGRWQPPWNIRHPIFIALLRRRLQPPAKRPLSALPMRFMQPHAGWRSETARHDTYALLLRPHRYEPNVSSQRVFCQAACVCLMRFVAEEMRTLCSQAVIQPTMALTAVVDGLALATGR